MTENGVTAIPVLDRESGAFVGSISSQDILDLITSEVRGSH
jgi:CBS domain-containing protein